MKRNKKEWVRPSLQIFFFLFIAIISFNHFLSEAGGGISFISSASSHATCPLGGLVSLYQYFITGTFVSKIHESSFILLGITLLLSLLFGSVFCGWICPFGSIQEWFGKIGRKLFKRKYNHFIPYRFDKYLRYLRYVVLIWVIYMTATTGYLIFADYDPYYALFNLWSDEVSLVGLGILIITLLLSLFVERPWCKYACPLGAALGLMNKIRIFQIRRNPSTCISCSSCDRICPMNIEVSKYEKINDAQCISCLQCTSDNTCPIEGTVELSTTLTYAKAVVKHEN